MDFSCSTSTSKFVSSLNSKFSRVTKILTDSNLNRGVLIGEFQEHFSTNISLVTRKTNNQGDSQLNQLSSLNDTFSNELAGKDTTENVNEDGFDLRVSIQDFEGSLDLFNISTTTNVQEISRRTTVKLDDIHGTHSQTSTINEATNVTIEGNISQTVLESLFFMRINIFTGN